MTLLRKTLIGLSLAIPLFFVAPTTTNAQVGVRVAPRYDRPYYYGHRVPRRYYRRPYYTNPRAYRRGYVAPRFYYRNYPNRGGRVRVGPVRIYWR